MTDKSKTQYKFYEAEEGDVTSPNRHRYQPAVFGAWGKEDRDVTLVSQIAYYHYPELRNSDEVHFSIKCPSGKKDYLKKTVTGLLAAAEFKDVRIKDGGSESLGVSVKANSEADIVRAICAMATTAPNGPSDYFYAVLDKNIAIEVIDLEMKRNKKTPTQVGLVQLTREPMSDERLYAYAMKGPFSFIDVDLSKASGFFPVVKMREDGLPAQLPEDDSTKNVFFVITRMELTHESSYKVEDALKAAGIKFEELKKDGLHIRVRAPADHIADVLGKAGLLPQSVVSEICNAAESGHARQRDINAAIESKPLPVHKPAAAAPK